MRFFLPQAKIEERETFSLFGWEHILLLAAVAAALFFGLRGIAFLEHSRAEQVIRTAAVCVPVLEFTHTIWLYLTGTTSIIKLLPLHLCAMQSIFIPLAVFTGKRCFYEFIYATSILGGFFGILLPSGVAGCYPLWHYQTLQTALLHALLMFIPLALIRIKVFRPDIRNFPKLLLIFLCVALAAAAVDFGFGENYMFLRQAPEGTPLVWIYDTFGHAGYLCITFLLLAALSLSLYLPFLKRKKQKGQGNA